jgi:hypothetical protein
MWAGRGRPGCAPPAPVVARADAPSGRRIETARAVFHAPDIVRRTGAVTRGSVESAARTISHVPTKPKPPKKPAPKTMSASHKAALATGRTEGRAVRNYLEALRTTKPKRGRKRTAESVQRRLEAIERQIVDADAMTELRLVQERRDLEAERQAIDGGVDVAAFEAEFVKVARNYSARQGISYAAWREIGVPAATLAAAGLTRSHR